MSPAFACVVLFRESPSEGVLESELIVIGVAASVGEELVFEPEAFLKGPATGEPLTFRRDPAVTCPEQPFQQGDRALIYVFDAAAERWPTASDVYLLKDGRATTGSRTATEIAVVEEIRALTGQYAVPAIADGGEGAGINWTSTVLPMGVVLAVVFGIGLVMMRVWHRIDPS